MTSQKTQAAPLQRIVDAWNNLDPEHLIAIEYSALGDAIRDAASAQPLVPETQAAPLTDEPQAWLFRCWRPGRSAVMASVDKNDSVWWPNDQWQSVMRLPLSISGPAEVLHGKARYWNDLAPAASAQPLVGAKGEKPQDALDAARYRHIRNAGHTERCRLEHYAGDALDKACDTAIAQRTTGPSDE